LLSLLRRRQRSWSLQVAPWLPTASHHGVQVGKTLSDSTDNPDDPLGVTLEFSSHPKPDPGETGVLLYAVRNCAR
jgi:hypothetical protein